MQLIYNFSFRQSIKGNQGNRWDGFGDQKLVPVSVYCSKLFPPSCRPSFAFDSNQLWPAIAMRSEESVVNTYFCFDVWLQRGPNQTRCSDAFQVHYQTERLNITLPPVRHTNDAWQSWNDCVSMIVWFLYTLWFGSLLQMLDLLSSRQKS